MIVERVPAPTDAETLALLAEHYRWWSVSASGGHLKLGPVTVCWYRWYDRRWRVEVVLLRWQWRIGGPLA